MAARDHEVILYMANDVEEVRVKVASIISEGPTRVPNEIEIKPGEGVLFRIRQNGDLLIIRV